MPAILALFAPVAHAATVSPAAFGAVLDPIITNVVNPLVELAFALALIVFVYGVTKMMTHEVGSDEHSQGKQSIIWGLVGLFIMASAWGIINIVANTVKQFNHPGVTTSSK